MMLKLLSWLFPGNNQGFSPVSELLRIEKSSTLMEKRLQLQKSFYHCLRFHYP